MTTTEHGQLLGAKGAKADQAMLLWLRQMAICATSPGAAPHDIGEITRVQAINLPASDKLASKCNGGVLSRLPRLLVHVVHVDGPGPLRRHDCSSAPTVVTHVIPPAMKALIAALVDFALRPPFSDAAKPLKTEGNT
ncbi:MULTISPECIES: hypothetical protein [Rhodopseudomonas]|uniref:Uncharacterized protein n=1 Tax=Rhodopseudomonas palustris TaxID=1076 RepID=A0A0D7DZY4_RHOPL|nr:MULTISPECIES: hypothetical protein [Rhodopseudomonas]KIZ34149.1 hypothetical protein OO17_27230 [Rhodopseudomonas palustris]MDF3811030.1 hypothetical protein [Rhodopseudomonas sp. BAL398]WOK15927.1 hypothetical protein RBJ75_17335 [Rhodopseudomonas sp. BAL398]